MHPIKIIVIVITVLSLRTTIVLGQTEIQKLIPTAKLKTENFFGYTSGISNNYLVVNEPNNDSLAYNAGIIHLFKKENEKWSPHKKLAVKKPQSNQKLGSDLVCSDSLIVAKANIQLDSGINTDILYIYRQNESGDWPSVESEAILLEDTISSSSYVSVKKMSLNKNLQLAIIYHVFDNNLGNRTKVKIIDFSGANAILLEETLNSSNKFFSGYNTSVLFKSDVLFISNPEYETEDRLINGVVFVFEKDINNDWSLEPTAVLTASVGIQFDFDSNMDYENNKLYVTNSSDDTEKTGLFIYEKPTEGWTDMVENRSLQKNFGYAGFAVSLTVQDDIIFWTVPIIEKDYSVYIPDTLAENVYIQKEIRKPIDIGDENMQFGFNPISTQN